MNRTKWSWDAMLMASVVAMAGICAQSQQFAFAQEEDLEGPIVQIGPASGDETVAPIAPAEPAAPQEPTFWIGLRGRGVEDPVLRTQLQLAEDTGIVIEDVVPDSPAEKAGLRKHDIILRANDDMVDSMETLQQHVQTGKEKPIELKILRLGKEETVTVTPAERPEDFQQLAGPESGVPGQDPFGGDLGRLLQQFQGGAGLPNGMRVFGPGMVLNGRQMNVDALPNGMSVSVTREGDGPAQITVKKGEQTWTVSSDDAKALAELPEDVRNVVSGMIQNQVGDIQQQLGNLDWQAELKHMLPDRLGNLPGMGEIQAKEDAIAKREEMIAKRMEQMELQLKELQERLEEAEAAH